MNKHMWIARLCVITALAGSGCQAAVDGLPAVPPVTQNPTASGPGAVGQVNGPNIPITPNIPINSPQLDISPIVHGLTDVTGRVDKLEQRFGRVETQIAAVAVSQDATLKTLQGLGNQVNTGTFAGGGIWGVVALGLVLIAQLVGIYVWILTCRNVKRNGRTVAAIAGRPPIYASPAAAGSYPAQAP